MALVCDNFRRHILWCAAKCPSFFFNRKLLGKTKICQLYVSRGIQKKILWFQVSVDDAFFMEVIKGEDDTSHIEPGGAVIEALVIPEDSPQLPAQARLHKHVQLFGIMECLVKLDYEWAAAVLYYFLLVQDVLLLLQVLDLK